jgi:O-antigen/teichoic acid export membrane protein
MATTTAEQSPRLSIQAFWLTASRILAAILNIALPVLLVRLLPQTEYGVYKQAFLFAGTVTGMASFGMGMSAFYFIPRFPQDGGKIALNIVVYNFIAGWIPLLGLVLYPHLLQQLFRSSALVPLAPLLGLLVLFTLTSSLVQQIPAAMQDVRWSTIFIVGTQLSRVVVLGATALMFGSVKSLIVITTLHQFASVMVLFWYLHDKFPRFWLHFDWTFFKEQLAYALPYGSIGLLWVVQQDVDNYFVSATSGPRDYAVYAVGWLDVPFISLFLDSVVWVLIVRISKLQQEGRKEEIRSLTAAASNQLAAIQFPLFTMLLVCGHDLIVLLYTRAYEKSADIFLVTIFLLPIGVLLLDPILRAYKATSNFMLSVRIGTFVTLCCALLPVIHRYGMMGAAVTAVGARITEHLILGWKVARTLDARMKDLVLYRGLFKVLGVVTTAGVVAYFVRNLINPNMLLLRIAAGGICVAAMYLPAIFIFRLPGYHYLTKKQVTAFVRSTLGRLGSASA